VEVGTSLLIVGFPLGFHDALLPWMLLDAHSTRMDMGCRDLQLDETLGLNWAWYADILLNLTK
jgi:hypothetical protein